MKNFLSRTGKVLSLVALMFGAGIANAQVNVYSYVSTTGNTLETGGFTNLIGPTIDDGGSLVTNIGFTFNFGGINYTQFSVSSNGLMRLGSVGVNTTFSNSIAGTGATSNISGWWDDLETGTDGNVQYKLMGVSPNQKLVVEWNCQSYNLGTNLPFDKTWQIWLFETSNVVEIVYGAGATPNSSSIFIANNGASDYQSITSSSNTVSTVATNDANATWPGNGRAYIFTPPAPLDAQAIGIASPLATGCFTSTENVAMTVKNNGTAPLDFSVNNMTVNVNVTGAVTMPLSTVVTDNSLNGGLPLAPGATVNVPVGVLDMTTAGTYTFNGNVSIVGDPVSVNDAISTETRIVSGGSANANSTNLCFGDSVVLGLTGYSVGGTIQWQDSLVGGAWTNIPGATTANYTAGPSDTTYYRAVVCSGNISSSVLVNVVQLTDPVANDTSRCGAGPVTLIANGPGTLLWFDMATGGSVVHIGDTLTTNVSTDTTFYVASSNSGGAPSIITTPAQVTTFTGNVRGMWFTAPTDFTITGLQAPGTGLQSITVVRFNPAVAPPAFPGTTNAFDILYLTQNDPTTGVIPVSINITSGDIIGVMSQRGTTVSYGPTGPFNTTIAGFPTTLTRLGMQLPLTTNPPQTLWQESGGNLGLTEITYTVGCQSNRVPVNVSVSPAPAINFTASAISICDVDTIDLTVTSSDLTYNYTYSPSSYLSDTTGNPVQAWPQDDITYVVSGLNSVGCAITDTVSIAVAHAPVGAFSMSDDVVCFGDSVTLNMSATTGATFFSSGPITNIPDNDPAGAYDTIMVSGVQGSLATGDLDSVCIDITHTFDGDLTVTLISPAGTMFDLSINEGGSGANYTNTCFSMNSITPISLGTAPFTGTFIPDGAGGFDTFNGENGNGAWQLWVVDGAGIDVGTINSWNITFANLHPMVQWSSIPGGLNDTSHTVIVTPTVTTTYIAALTDTNNGCTRNYVDTVTVNPLPVVTLGPDTAICSNYAGITLDGTNPGAGTYLWQDGQTGATYFASLPGNYSVQVTDTNGCVGSDDIVVGVITASVVNIDANLTTIHSADLDAGPNFASYVWSTSATSQVINVTSNGTYFVTCVDQNGCVSSDTMSIVFTLGTMNQNGTETTLQLFPNPSQGVFNLNIGNLETDNLVIDIMDMKGSIVYNRIVGSVSGTTTQSFNLGDLRMGTYNLRAMANGKTTTIRFVVTQ